jgi:uncharacterized integral membrane protein (TIGR00698 family)
MNDLAQYAASSFGSFFMSQIASSIAGTARPGAAPLAVPPWVAGLALTAALSAAGFAAHALIGSPLASPMLIAMLLGMAIRNTVGLAPGFGPGVAVALRPLLRFGIVLLGFRLTLGDLGALGPSGFALIACTLGATFIFTRMAGRLLGVDPRLSDLIAAGTSICGASAILAVNTVTRATEDEVSYSIACVTIFGSLSMLLFPLLAPHLGLSGAEYGLWAGASLHEVAQALGTGFAEGPAAGEAATIAKLARVALLAPLVLALGWLASAGRGVDESQRPPIPWFLIGFAAAVGFNSAVALPASMTETLVTGSSLMLTMALGAMGLETRLVRLRLKGLRPLVLGAIAWVFIATLAATLVRLA